MMTQSIPLQRWIELNWQVRTQLAKDLSIPKSKDVTLMDGRVISDGRIQSDIDISLTVESLQEYTGNNSENIFELFEKAIEKAEFIIYKKENLVVEKKEVETIKEEVKVSETRVQDEIPTNFMQLKKYAKEKGIDVSVYKTKKEILEQLKK